MNKESLGREGSKETQRAQKLQDVPEMLRETQRGPTKIWIPIGLPFHFLRECAVLPICLEPIFTLQRQIATAMLQANGLKMSLSM